MKKDWRQTARPIIPSFGQLKDELHLKLVEELKPKQVWKKTMIPEPIKPADGKSFIFSEHESEISKIVETFVLKHIPKFDDFTPEQKEMLKGKPGEPGKAAEPIIKRGHAGKDGTQIYLFDGERPSDELGKLNDLAIGTKKFTLYRKEISNEHLRWVLQGSFKGRDATGGGGGSGLVPSDVKQIVAPKVFEITKDWEIMDDQFDIYIITAPNPVTVKLPNAALYTKILDIKNFSASIQTLIPYEPAGKINDNANLTIPAKRSFGSSAQLFPWKGQFWVK